MSRMLDGTEFAAGLERAFGTEPEPRSLDSDLRLARKRLRRVRATRAGAGLAAVVVLVGSYAVLSPGPRQVPVAAGSEQLTDAQVVSRCLATRHLISWTDRAGQELTPAGLRRELGRAVLLTRAETSYTVEATLRSADARSWARCTVPLRKDSRAGLFVSVYRTPVRFRSTVVDGTKRYQKPDESDPAASGTDQGDPVWSTTCFPSGAAEDSKPFFVEMARCDTYTVEWTDRRPPEVARVRVHNPDGTFGLADVRGGYLSYAHQGPMTSQMRTTIRQGSQGARVVVDFYTEAGTRLRVSDYPSLAEWFKDDGD